MFIRKVNRVHMPVKEEVQGINVYIQRGPIDRKKRLLLITPHFIQFDDRTGPLPTKFEKNEICEYRFGINWIKGLEFTIGREYVIFIRNSSDQTMKISFKTFYGIRKKEYHKLSNDILTFLWLFFFDDITTKHYQAFQRGVDISIGRAALTKEAVIIKERALLKEKQTIVPWEQLVIKDYYTYLAIFSTVNALNTHATFSYLNEWNTGVLFSLINTILKNRKGQ